MIKPCISGNQAVVLPAGCSMESCQRSLPAECDSTAVCKATGWYKIDILRRTTNSNSRHRPPDEFHSELPKCLTALFDAPTTAVNEVVPTHVGRYRILRILGSGGFGKVYLAHDEQLKRDVALKVAHSKVAEAWIDRDLFLNEARLVANLDHPNIVPVYDVGSTADIPCFIVSKFIRGESLAQRRKRTPMNYNEVADLVAKIARALHYAHKQGVVASRCQAKQHYDGPRGCAISRRLWACLGRQRVAVFDGESWYTSLYES